MRTVEYLDQVKQRLGLPSDYALAQVLDVTKQAVYAYRAGKSHLDEPVCLRVAELLGVPPARVLADAAAERSKFAEARKVWQRLAATVGVFALCATAILAAPDQPTFANQINILAQDSEASAIYIMRSLAVQAALAIALLFVGFSQPREFKPRAG